MTVTDDDRARAVRVLLGIPEAPDRTGYLAAVLADERRRALAPMLALAAELADYFPDPDDEGNVGYGAGQEYAAELIRRTAEAAQ